MSDFDTIASALSFVPSDDRETWVRMAMGVKSALGDAGFDVWDAWSQGSEKYNARDARSTWASIKAEGRVTVGSLYAEAKRHGWRGEETRIERPRAAPPPRKDYGPARRKAKDMVASATWETHPYLVSKGFPEEKGLVMPDDRLVIPMRDAETGEINSVQTITTYGQKKFLAGGKAKGSVFMIGRGYERWLCEGHATALSVRAALTSLYRQATVIVCFSAANLAHVARKVRGQYVVADNDESGTGERYACKTGLPWWMPPEVGMDANDFHLAYGVRALANELNGLRSGERIGDRRCSPAAIPGERVAARFGSGSRESEGLSERGQSSRAE